MQQEAPCRRFRQHDSGREKKATHKFDWRRRSQRTKSKTLSQTQKKVDIIFSFKTTPLFSHWEIMVPTSVQFRIKCSKGSQWRLRTSPSLFWTLQYIWRVRSTPTSQSILRIAYYVAVNHYCPSWFGNPRAHPKCRVPHYRPGHGEEQLGQAFLKTIGLYLKHNLESVRDIAHVKTMSYLVPPSAKSCATKYSAMAYQSADDDPIELQVPLATGIVKKASSPSINRSQKSSKKLITTACRRNCCIANESY